ncbi:hypothetical protein [Caenimonas sp. SL110]|uniref:hypothetical protein n=1 Tax=Caenimonas sp. SL110 TaxID=1450524 RepID=UPI00069ED574|nr:hypothetical protein [Caenimonas sp. SL110]
MADDATAQATADAAVAAWTALHDALAPVIGQGGAAALYKRALHLARVDYPWLAAAYEGAATPGNFSSLHAALAAQDTPVAAAAHATIVRTLNDLLSTLIGPSLTERLLKPASHLLSAGPAVQDVSP